MSPGDRIQVIADWSSFFGTKGTITATVPRLMVVLDDDPRPIAVGEREIAPAEDEAHHAGAE